MIDLSFPNIKAKIQKGLDGKLSIYDVIRKKFIQLTPEEWVRQHIVHWLINHKEIPESNISIEKQLIINERKKRFDILCFQKGKEFLLIECKAPNVSLSDDTCRQIAVYNSQFKVKYLMISNGIDSILFEWSESSHNYQFSKDFHY